MMTIEEIQVYRNLAEEVISDLLNTTNKIPYWAHLYKFAYSGEFLGVSLMHEIDQLMENRDNDWKDDDINKKLMLIRNWITLNVQ